MIRSEDYDGILSLTVLFQCIKHGVTLNGFAAGEMRPPLTGLNKDDKRSLEQVIRVLKTTIAEIRKEG